MVSIVLGLILMFLSLVMGMVFSDSWIGLMGWIGFAMFVVGIDLGHIKRDVNASKPPAAKQKTLAPAFKQPDANLDSKEQ